MVPATRVNARVIVFTLMPSGAASGSIVWRKQKGTRPLAPGVLKKSEGTETAHYVIVRKRPGQFYL
jgi:hypothetical protein